jgi:capsid protein
MDSSQANYSSMRGDYLVYRKNLSTERSDLERVVLDPLFERWLDEAALVDGAIPDGLPPRDQWNWRWVWDGFEHIDPMKEAAADVELVNNNMASLADVCAKRGLDWRVVLRQRAIERGVEEEFGIRPEGAAEIPQDNQNEEPNQ